MKFKNLKARPHILFPASCGIPFQVLPDYQEGAEQVSQHFVLKYVFSLWVLVMCPIKQTKRHLEFAIHKWIKMVNSKLSKEMGKVNSQTWHDLRATLHSVSSRSSVDRAPVWCSGGHWFNSCWGLGFFLCPTFVSCWSVHSSQFTIEFQTKTSKRKTNCRAMFVCKVEDYIYKFLHFWIESLFHKNVSLVVE